VTSFSLDDNPGKPPTGRCHCEQSHWHFHDSPTERHAVSCLNCGAHWWMEGGRDVDGPPFTPYAEILAQGGLLPISHARRPPAPGLAKGIFPKGLTRFNYWNIPALNPWAGSRDGSPGVFEFDPSRPDEVTHEALSAEYRDRSESGNENAIFEFARSDAHAFRSEWFLRVVERWRDMGRAKDLSRLMAAYAGNRGRTDLSKLLDVIRKDQRVFRALKEEREDNLDDISDSDERLIRRIYERLYQDVVPARFTHEQFFQELEAITRRIEAAVP
jgi:hypothetical protein